MASASCRIPGSSLFSYSVFMSATFCWMLKMVVIKPWKIEIPFGVSGDDDNRYRTWMYPSPGAKAYTTSAGSPGSSSVMLSMLSSALSYKPDQIFAVAVGIDQSAIALFIQLQDAKALTRLACDQPCFILTALRWQGHRLGDQFRLVGDRSSVPEPKNQAGAQFNRGSLIQQCRGWRGAARFRDNPRPLGLIICQARDRSQSRSQES